MLSPWFLAGLAAASVLYSSVGHAGASGYLAVMALAGIDAAVMKPAALVLNVLVASIGIVSFFRAGYFSWSTFWPFATGSVPMAFVGGMISLSPAGYRPLLAIVLLVAAARMVVQVWKRDDSIEPRPPRVGIAVACGAGIGMLSGLTGTGGGIFLSPLLLLMNWAEPRRVAGISALFILVNSLSGLAGNLGQVRMLPSTVFAWAASAASGGLIGAYLGSRRLAPRALRYILAAVLVVAAGKLMFS